MTLHVSLNSKINFKTLYQVCFIYKNPQARKKTGLVHETSAVNDAWTPSVLRHHPKMSGLNKELSMER